MSFLSPLFQRLAQRPLMSLTQFNMLLALWLAAVLNVPFYQHVQQLSAYHGWSAVIFVLALLAIVYSAYFLLLQLLSWRFSAKFIAIFLITAGGLSAYFVSQMGVDIDKNQITNMMQTDTHEVLDLLSWHLLQWSLSTIILPVMVVCYLRIAPLSLPKTVLSKLIWIPISLLILLGLAFAYYAQLAPIFREHRNLKGQLNPLNSLSSLSSYAKSQMKSRHQALVLFGTDARLLPPANTTAKTHIMVLVVGETARAESFSLNGYHNNTNPELSKLDILNFSAASSCGTATAVSVPCMFSGMPRKEYDESLAAHREGLLDVAQRAGYQVTWIDNNSGCKRTCDRVNQFEIPDKLKQTWCVDGECYDDILLDSLQLYLQQLGTQTKPKNQLIVLHQMGSHGPAYYKRSTTDYQHFAPTCDTNNIQHCDHQSLVNSYDNSIVYTDHILAGVIKQLQQAKQYQTAMWYVSDHGESTGEHGLYLHGAPYMIAPSQQTHVPMILWFSQAWQQQQPQLVGCLKQQLSLPRGQDNLFPTMLSLLRIHTQVTRPALDMLSLCH